ncbi:histidine triad nucleotide-binding protein [Geomonas nitrogeniifigens]|uniref:Histidine triad nucleotide-binding protein n=1 Tax=Geomonas diazotrophica TaxID=2843197 RepID=A0ABX8JPF9_9BACT|nr:histidine triad nucleotide-binding protein [Geomonas nitrogeniifigens]QWV98981.1 histidine triad nucleotide-binding protein [Geomonas nitrogeniifigens]QXE88147.1 histidine triad nucleotide-binding protein [Geomonas nitrogeniifigens]
MSDCLFCKMAEGAIPVKKVYEDELLFAIEDINPVAPVHILIVPKKHLVNTLELTPADDQLIGGVHRVAAAIARERGFDQEGFRLVNNNNAGAGQSVWHIHFHLLAGRKLGWPPG